ncbi:uridine kinase [Cytophagales bacterium LB-30]|uniref:uridine/cytidine kinase n=1 Tax=Shiella aurantiaca TaxID=3058365 RepID=A0ABT8F263_9BACT|nr:uridine kinase [Shiella aurantiaca]MDN4164530.1 uridine kinase [Shiella aurantiaca]
MSSKPYIIGITGGSASGKTLLLKSLLGAFQPHEICLVSQDNYYRDRELQPKDENGVYNFDTPQSIDFDQYAADIKALKEGKSVFRKEYTFNNPNAIPTMIETKSAPIIVVEGIFVFYFPEVSNLIDLKVFIDANDIIKLKRRIVRDRDERGYDLEDVLYRYERHVAPTYEKYIKPFKQEADLVIPNNHSFRKALDVLIAFLKTKTV